MFEFKITSRFKDKKARTGIFSTPHGDLETPELAVVATDAEIRGIPQDTLARLPVKFTITNTFHCYTKSLVPLIQKAGGLNSYMNYDKVTSTDSGGFQVFSLGFGKVHRVGKIASIFPEENTKEKGLLVVRDQDNLLHIIEKGVIFNFEGRPLFFTPEMSIEIQEEIGADIIFAFDECTSPLNSHEYTKNAMERTHRWLKRCLRTKTRKDQALFGVVQGGYFEDLRKISAEYVGKQDVPGFGIGGSLGRNKKDMYNVIEWSTAILPEKKPRHLFGIGQVRDIFEAVERGIDLFDCVIPTREARHKVLYTSSGKKNLRKYKTKTAVLDKKCACIACKEGITYKKLYIYFLEKDPLAFYYSTVHNIEFFTNLTYEIRKSIKEKKFSELKENYFRFY